VEAGAIDWSGRHRLGKWHGFFLYKRFALDPGMKHFSLFESLALIRFADGPPQTCRRHERRLGDEDAQYDQKKRYSR